MSVSLDKVDPVVAIGALLDASKKQSNQLHAARYAYHKQVKHKYTMLQVLPPEQAKEMYRLAMLNYDELIKEAVNGHMTEANELDMEKGVGL